MTESSVLGAGSVYLLDPRAVVVSTLYGKGGKLIVFCIKVLIAYCTVVMSECTVSGAGSVLLGDPVAVVVLSVYGDLCALHFLAAVLTYCVTGVALVGTICLNCTYYLALVAGVLTNNARILCKELEVIDLYRSVLATKSDRGHIVVVSRIVSLTASCSRSENVTLSIGDSGGCARSLKLDLNVNGLVEISVA